jgi:hypothetical protein
VRTYSVLWAVPHTIGHANAVSECIDPDVSELVVFGVKDARKSVISALHKIAISLILCILEKILMVG